VARKTPESVTFSSNVRPTYSVVSSFHLIFPRDCVCNVCQNAGTTSRTVQLNPRSQIYELNKGCKNLWKSIHKCFSKAQRMNETNNHKLLLLQSTSTTLKHWIISSSHPMCLSWIHTNSENNHKVLIHPTELASLLWSSVSQVSQLNIDRGLLKVIYEYQEVWFFYIQKVSCSISFAPACKFLSMSL
jgi:hypothetical protein